MIKSRSNITPFSLAKTFLLLSLLTLFFACNKSKEQAEASIYTQRKFFRSTFHDANSEKMIGHTEKAISLFKQCLTIEPNNPAVHFALAELYTTQNVKDTAFIYAKRAYELNSKNKWYALYLADIYYEKGNFSKTAALYSTIIEEEKNLDLKFKYTDALIQAGQYSDAIDMLNEIEVETGKIPEVTFTKFDLLVRSGESEKAEEELQLLMDENPADTDYKILVAEFYMQQKNYLKSEEIVKEVLNENPTYGQAYIMLADLHLRQDRVDKAFENLAKGFENKSVPIGRKIEILNGLLPYTEKNQRDYEMMRSGISNLFDIIYDPESEEPALFSTYGNFLIATEQYAKAEKNYEKATALDPASFDTWLQLLNLNYELEHYKKLFNNGKEAAAIFPSQPLIYLMAGIGAKGINEYSEAEEWLFLGKDLVVQNAQLQSEFLYHLGDMNYLQGNTDEGEFYFDQALQLYASNSNVYQKRTEIAMKNKAHDQALIEVNKGLKLMPKNVKLNALKGKILFAQKIFGKAAEAFVQALYEYYYDPELLEWYGDALFLSGDIKNALIVWKDAVKYGNTSPLLEKKIENQKYYPKNDQ